MGGEQSKPEAAPQFFDRPWRDIKWEDKSSVLQNVKSYKPQTEGQLLRILLHGPVGAGKSSFINSIQSILHGRMYVQALADNTFQDCFTKKYTTYKISKGSPKTFYPFVFNDIMGLDPVKGVLVNDVKLAMMGHVMDGYTFNPESTLLDIRPNAFYNEHPTGNDKVHVLVCVVPANTISQVRKETVRKIQEIRNEASKLGIPQVAILTKIDEACPEVKHNLKNVYRVKYLKEKKYYTTHMMPLIRGACCYHGNVYHTRKHLYRTNMAHLEILDFTEIEMCFCKRGEMEEFSVDVGIPMNCIFPVKNYHEEIDLNSDVDSLILSSLQRIINFGEDFINFNRIPQVAIHTKTDEACAEIKDDFVDKNKCLKEEMEEFSGDVDIPMTCILPVKNYREDIDLSSDSDSQDRSISFHKSQHEGPDT